MATIETKTKITTCDTCGAKFLEKALDRVKFRIHSPVKAD